MNLEEIAHQFELAKLDYIRLGTQEQRLMDKRGEHWNKFFAVLALPSGAAGIVGIHGAIYLLTLIPFALTCIALEIKHDEQVLRYDVRKQMKLLSATWGFDNHDSKFSLESEHQAKRYWHGYYKYGRRAAFVVAEIAAIAVVSSSISPLSVQSFALILLNAFFVAATVWCMR